MEMPRLNYRFIYFNENYLRFGKVDKNEYNAICLRDAEKLPCVKVVSCPLEDYPRVFRIIFRKLNYIRINERIKKPFKRILYPYVFKDKNDGNKPYCFIIARGDLPIDYFDYLKDKYSGCKIVKIHRDLVRLIHRKSGYSEESMNRIFDLRLSYDQGDAEKYKMIHFDEIESMIDVKRDTNYPISDVFFAGIAKDRLPKVLTAYKIFTDAGLKCDFYITGVSKKDQKQGKGIKYGKRILPYNEMLYRTVNSRCMLDINQEGADGYTSRILEAIMYNKKIILDNQSVKSCKYYNPKYMQVVTDMKQINPAFVREEIQVDYHYEGDFSPIYLIEKIDVELRKKFDVPS